MAELNARSSELRGERARVRAALRDGSLPIARLFESLDEYQCVHDMAVLDVLRLVRTGKNQRWEFEIGRRAITDGVNLLVPVGRASERTLRWATVHAPVVVRKPSRAFRAQLAAA
jgi:hypothetical protein